MTVGSLFAGIGGFDLGFERAGFEIKWQVEIDPFCRRVLAKHWPDVRRYEDVRTVHATGLCGTAGVCDGCLDPVDVLCGGFPCQDISHAGRRVGIEGARSGLWGDYARLIGELRPRFVVVENSSALLVRGMGRVCGDLAALGYDAEWDVVSACSMGAPHARERVFLVAYPDSARRQYGVNHQQRDAVSTVHAHWKDSKDQREWERMECWLRAHFYSRDGADDTAEIFGMDDGVSAELDADRVKACGNAVVPQITEWIARRIIDVEQVSA